MTNGRVLKLWTVNVVSFILLVVLCITGLTNWFVLPKGYEARGSFLVSLRHFLVEVHEWMALLFIATIAIHIILHWTYVRNNLKKHGMLK